jgi:hypothetical protein
MYIHHIVDIIDASNTYKPNSLFPAHEYTISHITKSRLSVPYANEFIGFRRCAIIHDNPISTYNTGHTIANTHPGGLNVTLDPELSSIPHIADVAYPVINGVTSKADSKYDIIYNTIYFIKHLKISRIIYSKFYI